MRNLDVAHCALGLCSVAVMLAACGGSQPPIGAPDAKPQSVAKSAQNAHSGPLLYVSNDGEAHNVTVYRAGAKDPSPIETISNDLQFPLGICLDRQGTLYVVDDDGWVAEYPAGKTKASKIITKGINTPAFCAIDSNGNLWVTNIYGPNVTEYLNRSTKPHTVITKGIISPDGIAIDRSGNLYVANHPTPYSGNILVYSPGSNSPSRTITDGVTTPIGITVDAHSTLYVTNSEANNVEEYRSGHNHPYQTITAAMDQPVAVTVNKNGYLYVTDAGSTQVVEFAPGSITPSDRQISKGLYEPWGSAYSPPLLP